MKIKNIPLSQLVPSPDNVRKTGSLNGIKELAASIEAHGLLQNLQVRKAATGKFEVVARGRRHAALKLLAKRKVLAKDAAIGCNVLGDEDAAEIGLAENEMRQAMHPAEQFEAFKALIDSGHGIEDIAARFGVTPTVVRQRLKLAAVSPKLMALYRKAAMSLDQLMAFTVSDDHAAQEAAWFDAPDWQRSAHAIRQRLTAAHVRADDRRARFVTVEATFETGYAAMAIESWAVFDRLQKAGVIPAGVKFQISLPTPIAATYNNMVPSDRAGLLPALTRHFIQEVDKIAGTLPNDRIAVQWDVCQEVLAWEGYYENGPVDVRTETIDVLAKIGDAVPPAIDLGYHLCYGSPADEHMVQPKDAGIMVEIAGATTAGVRRPIRSPAPMTLTSPRSKR